MYINNEILPMDIKQCTSSIVEIKYGIIPGPDINAVPMAVTKKREDENYLVTAEVYREKGAMM